MIQAGLIFISVSSLATLVVSLLSGQMSVLASILGLAFGLVASYLFYDKESPSKKILVSVIFIFCSFQFLYLFYEKNPTDLGFYTLNSNNRGDLPFHINMIKAFAGGLRFWPENPILVGETLKYPFGMNLFNAQFEIIGIPLQTHLVFVGLFCLILALFSLQKWMGAWGVMAFFFAGSGEHWKNLFLTVFVTQRGVLFALPAGAFLLSEMGNKNPPLLKKRLAMGVIWGSLGFFHLHNFFIVSILLAIVLLAKKNFKNYWPTLVTAFVIGLPFVLAALIPSENWKSPVRWDWGWMLGSNENFLFFLIKNFGIWLGFLPALIWVSVRMKKDRFLTMSAFAVSFLFFNLILAPWAWDQIKILMWCYLFLNALIFRNFVSQWSVRTQIIMALIVFFPGVVDVFKSLPGFQKGERLFRKSELSAYEETLKDVSPNERIFITPRYDHPLFYFGKSVVIGYAGHIWSHGYSPVKLEDKIKSLQNSQDPARFHELGARFVLLDSSANLVKVPVPQSE